MYCKAFKTNIVLVSLEFTEIIGLNYDIVIERQKISMSSPFEMTLPSLASIEIIVDSKNFDKSVANDCSPNGLLSIRHRFLFDFNLFDTFALRKSAAKSAK